MQDIKPFYLLRNEDETGISGTGIVAIGAIYPSGKCVIEWLTFTTSMNIYNTFDQVVEVHGHGGKTQVIIGSLPKKKGRKKKE